MTWLSKVLQRQGHLILNNELFALLNVILLVVLPYTGWLAATIVALVTLRRGWRNGGLLLLVAVATMVILLRSTLSMQGALVGATLSYLPCYLAAWTLRVTRSWRAVAVGLFLQTILVMSMLHAVLPEYITQQFIILQDMLDHLKLGNTLATLNKRISTQSVTEQLVFANYLVGIQALGVVIATLISLMLARFIQSRLYYREGFKQEMLSFRGSKSDLLALCVVMFAVRHHYLLAVDVMPVLFFFFFASGLSLWFDAMSRSGLFVGVTLVTLVLGFFPWVILPIYILIGVLDILFNFRLYLPIHAGKAMRGVK